MICQKLTPANLPPPQRKSLCIKWRCLSLISFPAHKDTIVAIREKRTMPTCDSQENSTIYTTGQTFPSFLRAITTCSRSNTRLSDIQRQQTYSTQVQQQQQQDWLYDREMIRRGNVKWENKETRICLYFFHREKEKEKEKKAERALNTHETPTPESSS